MHLALRAIAATGGVAAPLAEAHGDLADGQIVLSEARTCHGIAAARRTGISPGRRGSVRGEAGEGEGLPPSAGRQDLSVRRFIRSEENPGKTRANPKPVAPGRPTAFAAWPNPQRVKDVTSFLERNGPGG